MIDSNMNIKNLPKNERPRERLLRYGGEALSNAELIAIILRSGSKREDIMTLSKRLLSYCGNLNGLLSITQNELMMLPGIKEAKASQILALSELLKRIKGYAGGEDVKITKPSDVANFVMEDMAHLKHEVFRLLMLNTKNVVIGQKDISIGSLNSSIVEPREVFKEAILKSSASIIVCHNHPSGDPTPSNEDINVTIRLKECGKILGVDLLDHIIIGYGKYISLKEKSLF